MGNKILSQLLSSEEKGTWPQRRKKNMTRVLMCISSSGSRAHVFQELGMTKDTKFYFASNKVKHSMKHTEIISTLQFTCCLKTTLTKSSPLMQDVGGWWKLKIGAAMETWLEEENNLDKWQDRLSAKVAGSWWPDGLRRHEVSLISNDKTFFKTLFERTGCLLTADGSDDVKISPRGLKNEQI